MIHSALHRTLLRVFSSVGSLQAPANIDYRVPEKVALLQGFE